MLLYLRKKIEEGGRDISMVGGDTDFLSSLVIYIPGLGRTISESQNVFIFPL